MADKPPQADASQFARTDAELLLGGKEIGTNAQGLGLSNATDAQKTGSTGTGHATGSASAETKRPECDALHHELAARGLPGQDGGFTGQELKDRDPKKADDYKTGYAEGQLGTGGVHIGKVGGTTPQSYGKPNEPGAGQQKEDQS